MVMQRLAKPLHGNPVALVQIQSTPLINPFLEVGILNDLLYT